RDGAGGAGVLAAARGEAAARIERAGPALTGKREASTSERDGERRAGNAGGRARVRGARTDREAGDRAVAAARAAGARADLDHAGAADLDGDGPRVARGLVERDRDRVAVEDESIEGAVGQDDGRDRHEDADSREGDVVGRPVPVDGVD